MKRLCLAILCTFLASTVAPKPSSSDKGDIGAEILWDIWGVPHIFASDSEKAAHAFGWAQMQSHGNLLLRAIATVRGRGAEFFGEALLDSDQITRTMGIYALAQKWRDQQTPEFMRYIEAFVSGVNDFGRSHPERLSPEARAVLPLDSVDIIAHMTFVLMHFVASEGGCSTIFVGHSNAWAIAPSRSASGRAMLLANPQVPWDIPWATFFEAHIVSPQFEFYGASLVGSPVFVLGFNSSLGWSLTVNTVDACDLYALAPDGEGYLLDGHKRSFSEETQTIKLRGSRGETAERPFTIRHAVQGPVIQRGGKLLAIRLAGLQVSSMAGALQQFWEMGRARNLNQFQTALRRLQIPMFNVIYADHDGHIFLLDNGQVPIRSKGDMHFWSAPVPGDTSSLIWNQIHPYRDLPQSLDPPAGWVQSSNGPPWFRTQPFGDPARETEFASPHLPEDMGGNARLGWLTPREQSGLRMLMPGDKISLDQLVEDKYSTHSQLADRVLDDLMVAANQYGSDRARQAARILQSWNRTCDADSRGAALFEFWAEEMQRRGLPGFYAQSFDLKRPLQTPHGLSDPKAAAEALDIAAQKLIKTTGQLDVPWGDLYRLRRGKVDVPANGAGDLLGTFRILDYVPAGDGRFAAVGDDNFIAAVEFGPSVRAKVLLTAGNSSDRNSPHFGDQLVLSSRKQLRDAWLTRAEIQSHLESRTAFDQLGNVISPADPRKN